LKAHGLERRRGASGIVWKGNSAQVIGFEEIDRLYDAAVETLTPGGPDGRESANRRTDLARTRGIDPEDFKAWLHARSDRQAEIT
jgi:hypothetical protein